MTENGISEASGLVSYSVRMKSKETKHEKIKKRKSIKKSHSIRAA